ncbi:MAG: hypothetical protein ABI127_06970, partial [Dokdonella sp.]
VGNGWLVEAATPILRSQTHDALHSLATSAVRKNSLSRLQERGTTSVPQLGIDRCIRLISIPLNNPSDCACLALFQEARY